LIIVVAILTLALAAMAGYLFLVQGPSNSKGESSAEGTVSEHKTYSEEELTTLALFEEKKYFNLKNAEGSKTISIIQTSVNITYLKEVKGVKSMEEKLKLYEPKMKQLIIKYFLGVSLDDINKPDAMDIASEVLTKQMNELLNEGEVEKEPKTFVTEVVFSEWVFQ
jgi:flagellar basal body-associated protein FliL